LSREVDSCVVVGEFNFAGGMESQAEGENGGGYCSTGLSVLGPVRKADTLDKRSCCGELITNNLKREGCDIWNVVGKVVKEEVPAGLAVYGVHRDETGRVHSISKEFKTHARGKFFYLGAWFFGSAQTNNTVISTLKNASERVLAGGCELNLGYRADGMDQFASGAV